MCLGLCGSEKEEREREADGVTQQMYERSLSFFVSLNSPCHLSIRSLFATYCRAKFLKVNNSNNNNDNKNSACFEYKVIKILTEDICFIGVCFFTTILTLTVFFCSSLSIVMQ